MDKDKILKAAQTNKSNGKEYEHKQSIRGSLLSVVCALLVGIGLFLLEYLVRGTLNFGLIAVGMTASSAQYLYEGITVKKISLIILGAVQSFVALFFILAFIGRVVQI